MRAVYLRIFNLPAKIYDGTMQGKHTASHTGVVDKIIIPDLHERKLVEKSYTLGATGCVRVVGFPPTISASE